MLGMYQYLDVFLTNLGVACTASAVSGRKIENKNKIKGSLSETWYDCSMSTWESSKKYLEEI